MFCFPSRQIACNKIKEFFRKGLVDIKYQSHRKFPGRPEKIVSLNIKSYKLLKKSGHITNNIKPFSASEINTSTIEY